MIRIEIWGDFASFNRPELKVERYSYDVITPAAARNILQAIYWHPSFDWIVDKIWIINPIKRMTIKTNEVKNKGSYPDMKSAALGKRKSPHLTVDRTQRSASILKDVRYVIEAHFVETGEGFDKNKIYAIFCERAKKGKCFHMPWLGTREFAADFRLVSKDEEIVPYDLNGDLGIMEYDIDFSKETPEPYYFHAKVHHGLMDLTECEVIR